MPYTKNSKLPPIATVEESLLKQGYTYAEVSEITATPKRTICTRNRDIWQIDIFATYAERIEREGIPCRLNVTDAFGHWFSGFFDGEGHFLYSHARGKGNYHHYIYGIQLALRDDDSGVLHFIQETLGVGNFHPGKAHGQTNPSIQYHVKKSADLAEVIVPLFDRYPLRAKKSREYEVWRRGIIHQYSRTLGGQTNSRRLTKDDDAFYLEIIDTLKELRKYKPQGGRDAAKSIPTQNKHDAR